MACEDSNSQEYPHYFDDSATASLCVEFEQNAATKRAVLAQASLRVKPSGATIALSGR